MKLVFHQKLSSQEFSQFCISQTDNEFPRKQCDDYFDLVWNLFFKKEMNPEKSLKTNDDALALQQQY